MIIYVIYIYIYICTHHTIFSLSPWRSEIHICFQNGSVEDSLLKKKKDEIEQDDGRQS